MFKRVRPLDAAIIAVLVAIVLIGAYLAYIMMANRSNLETASPASREIDAYIALVRKNPNDIDTRMRLAQALAVAGRDREAIEQYQQVLSINKNFVPALSGLGFELMKQKDWAGGETYFKRVIELTEETTPESARSSSLEIAYHYAGIALMEQKDYTGAVGYLKEALRQRRDASDTSYALAVCYQRLDIEDGQRDMLEYTLLFDPRMPEANYDYGLLLLKDGDIAGAAEHFRTSADEAPYKKEPQEQLDKLGTPAERLAKAKSFRDENPKRALGEARVAAALDTRNIEALLLVGALHEQLKDDEAAAEAYRRVLAIEPTHPEATAGLKRVSDGE